MNKILTIAWKELYRTLRDRNLLLIMFATPLLLSTIIGLAFGNAGSDTPVFADIPVAIVNLDEGFNLQDQINVDSTDSDNPGFDPADFDLEELQTQLNDLTFTIGGDEINLGEQLNITDTLDIDAADLENQDISFDGFSLNFGEQLTSILLSEPITTSDAFSGTDGGFDFDSISCELLDDGDDSDEEDSPFEGSLEDFLDAVELTDPDVARAGVDNGEYVVAIIIPSGFSNQLTPSFSISDDGEVSTGTLSEEGETGTIELYANSGRPIPASIVRSIVEGITNQFVRVNVALSALLETSANTVIGEVVSGDNDEATVINVASLSEINVSAVLTMVQNFELDALAPIGCLLTPGANNLTVQQQPLDSLQEGSAFGRIIASVGASQAVFFALFTGIFGILSIYDERRQWTLQRMIVSPMPRFYILAGKLLGNVVVVLFQLVTLMLALTLIASLVLGEPTFVWGNNIPAVLIVTLALSLAVSGLGVFVVGLAKTPEQVQMFGPMISVTLGALGGAFGFNLPEFAAQFSLIYWGVDAFQKIASQEMGIGLNLLVLFGQGILLFLIGSWLFKRRMEL